MAILRGRHVTERARLPFAHCMAKTLRKKSLKNSSRKSSQTTPYIPRLRCHSHQTNFLHVARPVAARPSSPTICYSIRSILGSISLRISDGTSLCWDSRLARTTCRRPPRLPRWAGRRTKLFCEPTEPSPAKLVQSIEPPRLDKTVKRFRIHSTTHTRPVRPPQPEPRRAPTRSQPTPRLSQCWAHSS